MPLLLLLVVVRISEQIRRIQVPFVTEGPSFLRVILDLVELVKTLVAPMELVLRVPIASHTFMCRHTIY